MAGAIDIAAYLVAHALAAFEQMGADPAVEGARRVLDWIRKDQRTTFTKRECYVANRSEFQRASKLDPVLALLEDLGYIREAPAEPRIGRPPPRRFSVNPNLFTQKPQNAQNGF